MKNLIPLPSEGKVRAKFADGNKINYPSLTKKRLPPMPNQPSIMQPTLGHETS